MRQPLSVSVYIQTSPGTGRLDKSYGVCSRECEKEQHRNVFEKHDDSGLIVIEHRIRRSEKDIPRNAAFQEQAKSRARYEKNITLSTVMQISTASLIRLFFVSAMMRPPFYIN